MSKPIVVWGFKEHFCSHLEHYAKELLEFIGYNGDVKCYIIGVRGPEIDQETPETLIVPLENQISGLFVNLLSQIEETYLADEGHKLFYSNDPIASREKPENIRLSAVRRCVSECFDSFDTKHNAMTFCGAPYNMQGFYIVPVIQLGSNIHDYPYVTCDYRNIFGKSRQTKVSFIFSCIYTLLEEATERLRDKHPGRDYKLSDKPLDEFARTGAIYLLNNISQVVSNEHWRPNLFMYINDISASPYESQSGNGEIVFAMDKDKIEYILEFDNPIPLNNNKWARKILQLAQQNTLVISSFGFEGLKITGLCDKTTASKDHFTVIFHGHYDWVISYNEEILLSVRYNVPKIPPILMNKDVFIDNFSRLFPDYSNNSQYMWEIFNTALEQKHGCMVVIANDAEKEAKRLAKQGTLVKPVMLTTAILNSVSEIDGSIMITPDGTCYAIGVILDGLATDACTPIRGARYNSAVRYISTCATRMAIVVSEDKNFDIIPLLKPRICKNYLEQMIVELESASIENFHKSRNWLDEHRFYLNTEQCNRINKALQRIDETPIKLHELRYIGNLFTPNPEISDFYFL